jgi:hypothetical protein
MQDALIGMRENAVNLCSPQWKGERQNGQRGAGVPTSLLMMGSCQVKSYYLGLPDMCVEVF